VPVKHSYHIHYYLYLEPVLISRRPTSRPIKCSVTISLWIANNGEVWGIATEHLRGLEVDEANIPFFTMQSTTKTLDSVKNPKRHQFDSSQTLKFCFMWYLCSDTWITASEKTQGRAVNVWLYPFYLFTVLRGQFLNSTVITSPDKLTIRTCEKLKLFSNSYYNHLYMVFHQSRCLWYQIKTFDMLHLWPSVLYTHTHIIDSKYSMYITSYQCFRLQIVWLEAKCPS